MTPLSRAPWARQVCLLPILLIAALTAMGHSQTLSDSARVPLTSIQAVQELGADHAAEDARTVKLRGVVTFVASDRESFKIHDGQFGIGASLPSNTPCPEFGDLVEVEGHTTTIDVQDHRYPHIESQTVSVSGTGSLPKPTPISVTELTTFAHYNQWVSVEGIVVMWTLKSPTLSIMISGPETWAVVHIRGFTSKDFPTSLHGARVRVTGVNMGNSHSQADTLIAPTPAHLEILNPGKQDPFDFPLTPMQQVADQQIPVAERVRIRGVVTGTTGKQIICLRDGDAAVCVGLEHGWLRSSSSGHRYADGGTLPVVHPGDEVEVVGSRWTPTPDSRENGFSLHLGHIRIVGSQDPPEPIETTLESIAKGALTHHLVQVRARLVRQDQYPLNRNQWRSTLLLEADGVQLPAMLQSRTKTPFSNLKLNDELIVTGLVDPATASAARQLWLTDPVDVVSLGLSPSFRQRQLWTWTGIAAAILALSVAWITTLYRSLKQRTLAEATAIELNQNLEQRVNERTIELNKAKSELKRALDQERELGELKSRFVTMVSHEFRTPLGIIMSAIELMRHYDDRLPKEQKHELQEDIHSATKLMAGLMEQVLVLGRVEAGKLGYRPAPVDIDVLAGKLTDESLSATNRKCPILWQPSGDLSNAHADESLLRHIFSNLITNAVKYSPNATPVIFSAHRDGTDAIFTVQDQGIGIPEQDIPNLFEAFYRCTNVGEITGTGLGLVIVKRCVDLHGGTIHLDSTPGTGTTFTIRLPLFT
jgi:signal transduction histidine kinase